MSAKPLVALDLFAGTGWGVACQRLGIEEHGVELMPEAVAVRERNGMRTAFRDVWDGLDDPSLVPDHDLHIASPPCQTFSMAGSGKGRQALDEVLALIRSRAFLDPAALRAFGEEHDPRTALVLSPLAYVARDTPRLVVFEQVPTVLPVWKAAAEVMREWGYSVAVEVLNAEQYGVPQTRKRAILVARWDGEARMPQPTHSRYYPRDKGRLDPGVAPWVSMAEALGWNVEPGDLAVRTSMGTPKVDGRNGSHALDPASRPMHTITSKSDRTVIMRSNYGTGGDASKRGERAGEEPAPTMTSKADRNLWLTASEPGVRYFHPMTYGRRAVFPGDEPAPTVRGVQRPMPADYMPHPNDAPIPAGIGASPATTVQGVDRVWPRGHKVNADDIARLGEAEAFERYGHRNTSSAMRVTLEEASALQSYPEDFQWRGAEVPDARGRLKPVAEGKLFLQVGNAVPPKLAEAILRELTGQG